MTLSGNGAKTRAGAPYHLTHWKCVNWHNLLTQEGPIRGRSVFNLGPNESGKTTWLDSSHLVLTLGHDMEWNSAADPVASKQQLREHGRKLGGVVHRVNDDLVLHPAAGLSYFALQLSTQDASDVLTIGLGVFSASPDSKPDIWGFIIPDALSNVSFQDPKTGNVRDQSQLEAAYGPDTVLNPIQYRRRLADRLYGSTANYQQILELLNLGKSYSRLSRESPRFTRLFRQSLPPVDRDQIERGRTELKDLRTLEDNVESTNTKLRVFQAIQSDVANVHRESSKLVRYAYKRKLNAYDEARTQTEKRAKDAEEQEQKANAAKNHLQKLTAKLQAQRGVVNELRASDSAKLVAHLEEAANDLQQAETQHGKALAKAEEARREEHKAQKEFEEAWTQATKGLDLLATQLGTIAKRLPPDADPAAESLNTAAQSLARVTPVDGDAPTDLLGPVRAAQAHLDNLVHDEEARKATAEEHLGRLTPTIQNLESTLDALERRREPPSPVDGLDEAIAEIREDVLILYQGLEPHGQTREAALLEAYLPKEVLAAVLPRKPSLVDKVRRHVHTRAPQVRVVDTRDIADFPAVPAASILAALSPDKCDPTTLAYLQSQFEDVVLLPNGADRDGRPRVVWRDGTVYDGKTWHLEGIADAPRLIGVESRRAAYLAEKARLTHEISDLRKKAQPYVDQVATTDERIVAFNTAKAQVESAATKHPIQAWVFDAFLKRTTRDGRRAATRREVDAAAEHVPAVEGWRRRVAFVREQLTTPDAQATVKLLQEAVQEQETLGGLERDALIAHTSLHAAAGAARKEAETAAGQIEPLKFASDEARAEVARFAIREGFDAADTDRYLDARGFRTMQNLDQLERDAVKDRADAEARIGQAILTNTHRASLRYEPQQQVVLEPHTNRTLDMLVTQLNHELSETRGKLLKEFQRVSQQLFVGQIAARLKQAVLEMKQHVKRINAELERHPFRNTAYFIHVEDASPNRLGSVDEANQLRPIAQMRDLILAAQAEESQDELARFMIDTLRTEAGADVPAAFDYRNWYEFDLRKNKPTPGADGDDPSTNYTSAIRTGGSGGGQAIPRYLFCFCLFAAVYNQARARLRLVLLDEAFQRVDPGNVNQLLEFARSQDLDLIVTNPDLDADDVTEDATIQLFSKNDQLESFIKVFSRTRNPSQEVNPNAPIP